MKQLGGALLMILLGIASASACVRPGIEGGKGLDVVKFAQRASDRTLTRVINGQKVTVHYPSGRVTEEEAALFLDQLADYARTEEEDYAILRDGIRGHLGEEIFNKVKDRSYLNWPGLATNWYLVVHDLDGYSGINVRNPPPGFEYRYLRRKDSGEGYSAEELRPLPSLRFGMVHEIVHNLLYHVLTSKRRSLPRWFEEGLADYGQMYFNLWVTKEWDRGREILARLTWDRDGVRRNVLHFRNPGEGGPWGLFGWYQNWRQPGWEADLYYKGSLGLMLGLESELGSEGLMDLVRELIRRSPETDKETIKIIEARLGHPIRDVGHMSEEARRVIFDELAKRARVACETGVGEKDDVPLAALGHLREYREEVVRLLLPLSACPDTEVAIQALSGLRYLGERPVLKTALRAFRESRQPEELADLERNDGRLRMAERFSRQGRRAGRWFGK